MYRPFGYHHEHPRGPYVPGRIAVVHHVKTRRLCRAATNVNDDYDVRTLAHFPEI